MYKAGPELRPRQQRTRLGEGRKILVFTGHFYGPGFVWLGDLKIKGISLRILRGQVK